MRRDVIVEQGLVPAWVSNLVMRHARFASLIVPAYLDLDEPTRVTLFPQAVFVGSGAGYLHLSIDGTSGQLQIGEALEAFPPPELLDEPAIRPMFVDLTANYVGDGPPVRCESFTCYLDEDSDPERGRFRAISFEFGDSGEGVAFDPFSISGIRIISGPGLVAAMHGFPKVDAVRLSVPSNE